jgi:hypothetical protein
VILNNLKSVHTIFSSSQVSRGAQPLAFAFLCGDFHQPKSFKVMGVIANDDHF